jgi:amylosucrase
VYGGIPLLYMGDELGLRNDSGYLADPALAGDNRWTHRPPMDWAAAQRRHDPTGVEGRIFAGLAHLARVRAGCASLHAGVESQPVDVGADAVLGLLRRHPAGPMLALYNVTGSWQRVTAGSLARLGFGAPHELISDFRPRPDHDGHPGDAFALPPYAAWWLTR